MADTFKVGPCAVLYGDPSVALGAGMVYLGKTKGGCKVTPKIKLAMGKSDQTNDVPLASAVFRVGSSVLAQTPFLDQDKTKLTKLLPGSAVVTATAKTALALGSGFSKLAQPGTLCLLPVDQMAQGTNGIDATDAIWIPSAVCDVFGDFMFELPTEGEDSALTPHETAWMGLYTEVDLGAGAIPASGRMMFVGPPAALGLTWTLPVVAL